MISPSAEQQIREEWDGYDPSLHWNAEKGQQMAKDVQTLLTLLASLSQELERTTASVRAVRNEMLGDGYRRPNKLLLLIDAVLGEEHK